MRSLFLSAVATLAAATSAVAAPLEAYGRLPLVEDIAMSGDGKYLAVQVTNGEIRSIRVIDVATTKLVSDINAGDAKLRDLQWADAGHLMITHSVTGAIEDVLGAKSEHFLTNFYDLASGKTSPLFKNGDGEYLNITLGRPVVREIGGKVSVLVHGVTFAANHGVVTLFQAAPDSNRIKVIQQGNEATERFTVDDKGVLIARTEYEEKRQRWTISAPKGGGWRTLAQGSHPLGAPVVVGMAQTPGSLLVSLDSEDGGIYKELSLADGAWSEPLPYKDTDSFIRNRAGRLIGVASEVGEGLKYTFFDATDQAAWLSVVKAYPGEDVRLMSWSDDHKKIVVRVDSPTQGPAYALIDMNTRKATWLASEYPELGDKDISPVKAITYKAKDGLDIPGYLTLPKNRPAKALPLVVLAHGGPAARDYAAFDWWVQALASQGYAVLQANFRGSDGLGVKFLEAGHGEFGRKMQTDLSDGVRYLAGEGIIDPKRVCIVGASYGGYAALAGATIDTGVYRCAVSVAGISDLGRMLKRDRRDYGDASFRYWATFIGVDGVKDPDLTALSPLSQVAKADAPILLIHGKDDTVVLYEQSRLMEEALRRAEKTVEMVTLNGEDHWLSRGATRQQMLKATVDFLKKINSPD